jgi:peroxiredoxin
MKNLSLLLISAVTASTAFSQEKPFTVTGKLSVPNDVNYVFLNYSSNGNRVLDSVKPVNGVYSFKGKIADASLGSVSANFNDAKKRKQGFNLYMEGSNINIEHTDTLFGKVKVSGSMAHAEFDKLTETMKPYNQKLMDINKKYADAAKAKDQAEIDRQREAYNATTNEVKDAVYGAYVKNNPSSPLVGYALNNYAGPIIDVAKVEPFYNSLPEQVKTSKAGKTLWDRIEKTKKTEVGQIAPDFTQNDTLGRPVSLSSHRGKYLLVDFWASWCGPCRQENPNIVAAFNKYKDKGFSVFGVSLDDKDKDAWMKAIHDDKLYWTQVSDLKYWENEVSTAYGIRSIPQSYLLDPTGKIIAKNLRGEALIKKLDEVFAGK